MILIAWNVLCQLAPWLLLGMLFSGLISVLVPPGFVQRKLQGPAGVLKAVLLGIPLPLCSCGVVPAGIGLKNQGASNGASVGFLISTPQTGVDSILVSASFFGWPFAIFKMVTAGITGVVGGWLTDQVEQGSENQTQTCELDSLPISSQDSNQGSTQDRIPKQKSWMTLWEHSVEILRSIWSWLLLGVIVSALIEQFVPDSWFQTIGAWGLLPSMVLVLIVSTPLYVCATASVPIAAALVAGGMPPAAALVFLMAGPATNFTTIGAIYGRFGGRTTGVYLSTIVIGSMFFAWVFDWLLTADVSTGPGHEHDHENIVSVISASILLVMMIGFAVSDVQRWFRKRTIENAMTNKVEVIVRGMTCGGCVDRVETAMLKEDGVESVSVDLKSGVATILGNPRLETIEQTITALGFQFDGEKQQEP